MNNKSMFFSLIAILMVLVIVISYKISTEKSLEETKIASTQTRIKALNSFINDLENVYFENMLKVAAKTALQALSNYSTKYFDDPLRKININEESNKLGDFETVMLFSYLEDNSGENCEKTLCKEYKSKLSDAQSARYTNHQFRKIDKDLKTPVMQYYSFFDLLNKTEITLENLGVRTDSFSITISNLEQKDYWTLHFKATIDYHFIDKYDIASWRGRTEKEFDINIYGFEDPKYKKTITTTDWEIDRGLADEKGNPIICISPATFCQFSEPSFLGKLEGRSYKDEDQFKGICPKSEDCYER